MAPQVIHATASIDRLEELETNRLDEPEDVHLPDAPKKGEIVFDDVTFRYAKGDREILSHFTHEFKPGSKTALMGETGVGKSTLFRLMLGFIKPTSGLITHLPRSAYVFVPQGNTLMSGSVRYNLLLAKPSATEEELNAALHTACADFVHDLPQGLDTVCTEAGGGLSEGQAQRIAIARALLRNRSIMLFDEATSALDPDTERQLLENILSDRSKTVIFITHRPAVVDYCDQVLRVE
jgi:ABC-type multidrug transport system fused ATPase/permease subunit